MRRLYLALGLVSLSLGIIGAFLPLLPTVPFLLLAAFLFARGNPAWEKRLLDHPRWGPPIHDWRARRAIGRRAKYLAIASLVAGAVLTYWTLGAPYHWISLGVLAITGTWIATRPE